MSQESVTNRCLDALELLACEPAGIPLTVIAQRLKLAKSATHRLLTALQEEGCVAQDPHSQFYKMTMRIPIMGFRHLAGTGIVDACQPYLDRLASRTGELVRMTVADDGHLTWVAKAQGAKSELRFDPEMGRDVRLHTTASGRAWLASLPLEAAIRLVCDRGLGVAGEHGPNVLTTVEQVVKEVKDTKRRGYGIAIDEDINGMSAVAAVISTATRDGPALGTVSVAGPSVRLTRSRLESFAKDVLAVAKELAAAWPRSVDAVAGVNNLPGHRSSRKATAKPKRGTRRNAAR